MAYERATRHHVGREDLRWLLDVVAPGSSIDGAVVVTPSGGVWRALPSATRPWVLAPALGRRASVRALLEGRRHQSRRVLAVRAVAATAAVVRRDVTPASHHRAGPEVRDLLDRLRESLGGDAHPVVVIGESDPNRKPTLQLVTSDGRTRGFAKVGYSRATRDLVGRDAAALKLVSTRLGDTAVRAPEVLLAEPYDELGLHVLVTSPIPESARAWPVDEPPEDQLLVAVATALADDGLRHQPVDAWTLWSANAARLDALEAGAPEPVATIRKATARLRDAVPAGAGALVGGWHGDLAPWNVVKDGAVTWVWDFEHSAPHRPLGLDLLHWTFAVQRHVRRRSASTSLAEVVRVASSRLPLLGADPSVVPSMVLVYLVERWLRAAELAAAGSGWDPAVHPEFPRLIDNLLETGTA